MRHAITALVLAFVAIMLTWQIAGLQNHLDDLDARITTLETIRIEYHAPPEGGQQ